MLTRPGRIEGLHVVEGIEVFGDERGSFHMWWRQDWDDPDIAGLPIRQLNSATNRQRGTTRGSHVAPWAKFAHPLLGRVFVVAVDARRGSPSFGTVEEMELDETAGIYIPAGCGHAYQTVDDTVVYAYAVDELWFRGDQETGVSLLEPPFDRVGWPVADRDDWVMSDKDRSAPPFAEVFGG